VWLNENQFAEISITMQQNIITTQKHISKKLPEAINFKEL